tara:strand:+ start:31 stop:378 length:348 start_codon:yes stop_codon:yes gene_type:complete
MNYLKLLNRLKKNVMTDPGYTTVEYFRKDFISVWIWIYILENHFQNTKINIQNIIEEIPYQYASRPTLYKIIDSAVAKKYFIKIVDEKDKRKFNLFPSTQVINEFKEWSKLFKGF